MPATPASIVAFRKRFTLRHSRSTTSLPGSTAANPASTISPSPVFTATANLAGIDPRRRCLTPLFNPRRHKWERHFRWRGAYVAGRTALGRTTVMVLNMNGAYLLGLRQELLHEGLFPPANS